MKRTLLGIALGLFAFMSGKAAFVDYTNADGVIYTLDTVRKTATLKTVPWNESFSALVVPDEIAYQGENYPVTTIGQNAGETCARFLTSVKLGANVTLIDDLAFRACENIEEVVFNENLKEIGNSAFYGCRLVPDFKLPEGLETIGYYSFYNCQSLKKAVIPASVKNLGGNPWGGCTGLKYFEIADGNENFKVVNDVLFNKDVTLLISYPIGKPDNSYVIPSTVKVIGNNSMRNNSSLSYIYLNDGLETIEAGAFNVCNLRSVEIPASVTEIGERVFTSNPNLTEIVVAADNKNYKTIDGFLCTIDGSHLMQGIGRADVVIPEEVQYVDGYAFYHFTNIQTVKLSNAKAVGDAGFYSCPLLTSVDFGNSLQAIGQKAFMSCTMLSEVVLPSTMKEIAATAFAMDAGIEKLELNDGLQEIGDAAFAYCGGIPSIKFPASIKKMGQGSFSNCTSLLSAEFAEGTEKIPDMILGHCSSLRKVTMPNSVKEIGMFAFGYCSELTDVTIPESLEYVGVAAFEFVPMTEFVMPKNVHTVEEFAFGYCDLRKVIASPALKKIGQYAFGANPNLSTVSLNEGLETIDEGAFGSTDRLVSFTIPSTVKNIGSMILQNCKGLTEINNKAVVPQTLKDDIVSPGSFEICKLVVPAASLEKYKTAAYWSNFNDIQADASSIEAVEGSMGEAVVVGYYDSKGAFSAEPVNGVNIVRYSDGTTKKVFYQK